jgi:hypothetical protein
MVCRQICRQYKAKGLSASGPKYENGRKRCTHCEIYIDWEGIFCPCCNFHLRRKPRYGKYRQRIIVKRN